MIKLILIVGIVILILSSCSEEWHGFVYPNKNDLSNHVDIGIYKSLKECRDSALNTLNKISQVSIGDYECGLNCKSSSGDFRICDKTER